MKVQVIIPTSGNPRAETVEYAYAMCASAGQPPPKIIYGKVSAAESKSHAAYWFLHESDADFMFMLDHDVVPHQDLLGLADHQLDIVAAPYLIFTPSYASIPHPGVYRRAGSGYLPVDGVFEKRGLVQCDAVVGGAMCVKRKVLETIKPVYANEYDEWGRLTTTEDVRLCRLAALAGFLVWADFDRRCEHIQTVRMGDLFIRISQSVRMR